MDNNDKRIVSNSLYQRQDIANRIKSNRPMWGQPYKCHWKKCTRNIAIYVTLVGNKQRGRPRNNTLFSRYPGRLQRCIHIVNIVAISNTSHSLQLSVNNNRKSRQLYVLTPNRKFTSNLTTHPYHFNAQLTLQLNELPKHFFILSLCRALCDKTDLVAD